MDALGLDYTISKGLSNGYKIIKSTDITLSAQSSSVSDAKSGTLINNLNGMAYCILTIISAKLSPGSDMSTWFNPLSMILIPNTTFKIPVISAWLDNGTYNLDTEISLTISLNSILYSVSSNDWTNTGGTKYYFAGFSGHLIAFGE